MTLSKWVKAYQKADAVMGTNLRPKDITTDLGANKCPE
jgi:hypothetical protein